MKIIIILVFILLLETIQSKTSKTMLFYLSHGNHKESDVDPIVNNKYNIPVKLINCQVKNCAKYKGSSLYPQLVLWNGPGCSYKQINPPNIESLERYFIRSEQNPIKFLKDFLQKISLVECFAVAIGTGSVLFAIFSVLFKDRSKQDYTKQFQKLKNK